VSKALDEPELTPATSRWMSADGWRVVMARAIRSFGYGFTSILLGITLASAGFSTFEVGLVLTVALVGDIIAIILVALFADRIGRRRVLVLLALLMAGSGLAFAFSRNLFILLLAAFFGTLSPSSADNAPFAAIEQAILPQTCMEQRRTEAFARYNLMAQLAGAAGGLAVILPDILHRTMGMDTAFAVRAMFAGYALIALAMGTFFLSMSNKIEASSHGSRSLEAVMVKTGSA
jgi:MFS family permease